MKQRLTRQQESFVRGLLQGMPPRQAYMQAYETGGMKEQTVDRRAHALRQEEKIEARYRQLMQDGQGQEQRREVASPDEVLEELSSIGMGAEEPDGEESERPRAPGVRERLKALELLGKHYSLFTEQGKKNTQAEVRILDDLQRD